MRFVTLRMLAIRSILVLLAGLLGTTVQADPEWTATSGEMGVSDSRYAINIGGNYSVMSGSEVENADPSPGFEFGASYRFWGNLSVFGSFASNKSNVQGQTVQLLDQQIRDDGRSATVDGDLKTDRIRAGIRLDALREQNWRFHPYVVAAVVFSKNEVTLNTVDGESPPFFVTGDPPDFPTIDITTFNDSQVGGLARFGVEYGIGQRLFVDLNGTYEVIEFPAGTNALGSVNTGLVVRL